MVTLIRMASEIIADRANLFEIFTKIKGRSGFHNDVELATLVDDCVDLWTKMFIADQEHDNKIVQNVKALQVINLGN